MHRNTTKLFQADPLADAHAARMLESLDAQIAASAPGADWQPIKTAPRDGTRVIVWAKWRNAPAGPVVARWNAMRQEWVRDGIKRGLASEILAAWRPVVGDQPATC